MDIIEAFSDARSGKAIKRKDWYYWLVYTSIFGYIVVDDEFMPDDFVNIVLYPQDYNANDWISIDIPLIN